MIRFQPDTWRDAVWRPVAMAAPDPGLYVEIMAPDLRFAALLLLSGVAAWVAWRRRERPGLLFQLLAFCWLAFLPWLATSGNGRYFIAVLLLAGPLCVALVHRMPLSGHLRLALTLLLVASQATVVAEADPRRRWSLMPWGPGYFQIDLTAADRQEPATWVMITSLSYSLVAPQFNERSRWMNLSGLRGAGFAVEDDRARQFLDAAVRDGLPLKLLLPTAPAYMDATGQPNPPLRSEIDRSLGAHRLALSGACETRRSSTMIARMGAPASGLDARELANTGFWICPLRYPLADPPPAVPTTQERLAVRAFEQLERQCPRLFTPGEGRIERLQDGFVRHYPGADMRAYVMDDGQVRFKYWRALNPNAVGTVDEVLAPGFRLDCHQVRGRSGLPWERRL